MKTSVFLTIKSPPLRSTSVTGVHRNKRLTLCGLFNILCSQLLCQSGDYLFNQCRQPCSLDVLPLTFPSLFLLSSAGQLGFFSFLFLFFWLLSLSFLIHPFLFLCMKVQLLTWCDLPHLPHLPPALIPISVSAVEVCPSLPPPWWVNTQLTCTLLMKNQEFLYLSVSAIRKEATKMSFSSCKRANVCQNIVPQSLWALWTFYSLKRFFNLLLYCHGVLGPQKKK